MRNYYEDSEDDFGDEFEDELTIMKMKAEKETIVINEFIKNCNDAYSAIVKNPDSVISGDKTKEEKDKLILALNRISALFIIREEYEKCEALKNFVNDKIPGETLCPLIQEVSKFLGE
jgi:hypothetical protein